MSEQNQPAAPIADAAAPLPLSAFDYDMPQAAIAQAPCQPRDASRLLHLPAEGALKHLHFFELTQLLRSGDLLVVNTTQVIPARLMVRRQTGARIELLFMEPVDGPLPEAKIWRAMARNASSVAIGEAIVTPQGAKLTLVAREEGALRFAAETPLWPLLQAEGQVPLPPYIARTQQRADDAQDYQSMFAEQLGAVAAPTASLHFTPALHAQLQAMGVQFARVCLHVGPGTFLPVRPEHAADVRGHHMHSEAYDVPEATAVAVAEALAQGRRVIPVGTTSLRALETWGKTGVRHGHSELFITPGYRFAVASALITNFHLPRSTLLMLVSAMAGHARIFAAYKTALQHGYRFFSYGDAMFIQNQQPPQGLSPAAPHQQENA